MTAQKKKRGRPPQPKQDESRKGHGVDVHFLQPKELTVADVHGLLEVLRARGVSKFRGMGVDIEFAPDAYQPDYTIEAPSNRAAPQPTDEEMNEIAYHSS